MKLTVKGLDAARSRMNKEKPYVHLWGRYGESGDHRTHCKNFRFGWQVFEVNKEDCRVLGQGEVREPITRLRPDYQELLEPGKQS